MNKLNEKESVQKQYAAASGLRTRISIHDKYSTNKQGFGNWITSNYSIPDGARLLELGCGTGSMWKNHLPLLEHTAGLLLTDFSDGMLEAAKANLGTSDKLSYARVDIQAIPFAAGQFDIVIANMMLYHVPDLHKGLAEVRRVMKDDGSFYCATFGEHGILDHVADLLPDGGRRSASGSSFTLQNGGKHLARHFSKVECLHYEDALEVTDVEDLLDYIESARDIADFSDIGRDALRQLLTAQMKNGVLHIPKDYGMFVCRI